MFSCRACSTQPSLHFPPHHTPTSFKAARLHRHNEVSQLSRSVVATTDDFLYMPSGCRRTTRKAPTASDVAEGWATRGAREIHGSLGITIIVIAIIVIQDLFQEAALENTIHRWPHSKPFSCTLDRRHPRGAPFCRRRHGGCRASSPCWCCRRGRRFGARDCVQDWFTTSPKERDCDFSGRAHSEQQQQLQRQQQPKEERGQEERAVRPGGVRQEPFVEPTCGRGQLRLRMQRDRGKLRLVVSKTEADICELHTYVRIC